MFDPFRTKNVEELLNCSKTFYQKMFWIASTWPLYIMYITVNYFNIFEANSRYLAIILSNIFTIAYAL